jgi:hypothetical protein
MRRHYIVGCFAGWVLWIVLIAIEYMYSASISDVPKAIRPVTDLVVTVIGLAAWPFACGLWWLSGQSYLRLIQNVPLNIAIGLALWGTLGVLVAKWRHRRRPLRAA